MELARHALEIADTPGTRVRSAATAADAALQSHDVRAGPMCAEALECAYREQHWLMVDVALAHTAKHLEQNGQADLSIEIATYLRSRPTTAKVHGRGASELKRTALPPPSDFGLSARRRAIVERVMNSLAIARLEPVEPGYTPAHSTTEGSDSESIAQTNPSAVLR